MSNLGAFFLAATIISLLVSTFQTKLFRKNFAADLLCMAAIILILGIDTFFALGLNYKAPYTGVIKYDYQTLPFFCLLAGSLLVKWQSLFTTLTMKLNRSWLFFGIASAGAVCLTVALFTNFFNSIAYSHLNYLVFTAEGVVGYSFFNSAQIIGTNSLVYVQYMGLAVVLSGLLWIAKDKIRIIATL